MPRPSQGPRLYLRRNRTDSKSGARLPDIWFIRDGARQLSTGCGPDRLQGPGGAQEALARYILAKGAQAGYGTASRSDPAQVLVVDVLTLYIAERGPALERDGATTGGFGARLMTWWAGKTLSEVRRSACKAYVAHRIAQPNSRFKDPAKAPRISSQTARIELEMLSAAIGYWHGEDPLQVRPVVWLPDKSESSREALTRGQAARLLRAARGWRWDAKKAAWTRLSRSAQANRRHVARFILIGLYTGTRHTAIRRLLWAESPTQAWVDLDRAMIWRRGRAEPDHPTKRRPVVKLPLRLLAHLRRWRRLDEAESKRRPDPVNAVIHHGGEALAGKLRRGFAGCVADAGLPAEITPHWLRHTAATWLMEADVESWKAAGFLGMTTKTLEDHYGHHRPSYQSDAAGAIGRKA